MGEKRIINIGLKERGKMKKTILYKIFYRECALRIVVGIMVMTFLLAGGANATKEIDSCTPISSPGEYVLNQSIIDSSATYCINIASGDVIFDGYGFTIDGVDGVGTYGVFVYNSTTVLTNVTIKNLTVADWDYGIYYQNAAKGSILYNNASSNNYTGIYLDSSSNNNLTGNNASSNIEGIVIGASRYNNLTSNNVSLNSYSGISLYSSSNNTLTSNSASANILGIYLLFSSGNTLTSNTMNNNLYNFNLYSNQDSYFDNSIDTSNTVDGKPIYYIINGKDTIYDSSSSAGTFYCIWCNNVTIKDSILIKSGYGILFWKTSSSKIENVNASSNLQGISLYSSSNNTLTNNTASSNYAFGIDLSSSSNNTLTNNTASSSYYGIFLEYSSNNNNLSKNTVNSNNYGFYLQRDSNNNNLTNNNASNNSLWDFYSYGNSIDNLVTNLTINPRISFKGKDIAIKSASAPANDPGGYQNIGKYINATNNSADSWLFLNVSYSDSEVSGLNENTLRMWKYNGSWSQVAGTNGVNPSQNYVYMNTTEFGSIFAPMAESPCRTISSPGTYVLTGDIIDSSATYCFNITSSDVIFDGNGSRIDGVSNLNTYGVYVYNSSTALTNVTVKNLNVTDWYNGIYYNNVANGAIDGNNASNNTIGIDLSFFSNNITLSGNNALNNSLYGIVVSSSNNTLRGNNANSNGNFGTWLVSSSNNTLSNNSANSNNYYGLYLLSSSNNTLNDNTALNNSNGIYLSISSNNNTLSGNTASNNNFGIFISSSSNNTLLGNTASSNDNGIYLFSSSNNNTLRGNSAANNSNIGIYLFSSSNNNTLRGNSAANNSNIGIAVVSSSNNTLSSNTAPSNSIGIALASSSNNTLSGNSASNNSIYGIFLSFSSSNSIYNNFFNNTDNFVFSGIYTNYWNTTKVLGTNIIGGLYLGGNVWANPLGNGFSQTCADIGNDGICDSPYALDSSNIDFLPLVHRPAITVQSATGNGPVNFLTDAGKIESLTALNVGDIPAPPPPGTNFPYGLFRFNVTGMSLGGSVNITMTFPGAPSATYYKYGPNITDPTPHWYTIPSTINDNNMTIMLTDGGTGDDDLTANGTIEDDSGPSIPFPEATIRFDTVSKDIKIYNETGSEANFVVLPSKKEKEEDKEDDKGWELRRYALKAPAKNSLVLVLKHKKEGKEAEVKIISMQYNGGTILAAPKNKMHAEYSEENNGALKELGQKIEVTKLFDAEAKYSAKKDETEIKVRIEGQKELKVTKSGIAILELLTDRGGLKLRY